MLFCPGRSSATWPRIAAAGLFCASVLADGQRELARKFGATQRTSSTASAGHQPNGAPILHGVLAWAVCTVEAVHEAGDHFIVIARVSELGECVSDDPLLFYRGRFTLSATTDGDGPAEVVDTLLAWPRYADWM